MPQLSAIVITKNEAANIGECLDSLAFCDERIVVDCGSSDATVQIARGKGARVEFYEWSGDGPQRNYALSLATGAWVLNLDADERVPPALAAEIKGALAGAADAFEFPRLNSFCGRPIRHSGWYPDYVLRLFRRGKGRFKEVSVHTRLVCDGPIGRLRQPLVHYAMPTLEAALGRVNAYSTARAQMMVEAGRRVTFLSGLGHGLFAFFRSYILRGGFLDGADGFLIAVITAETSYYPYMKAWLMRRRRR